MHLLMMMWSHARPLSGCSLCMQVQQLTDSLKRALAEMENVRARTTREVENTKKFAVQVGLRVHL